MEQSFQYKFHVLPKLNRFDSTAPLAKPQAFRCYHNPLSKQAPLKRLGIATAAPHITPLSGHIRGDDRKAWNRQVTWHRTHHRKPQQAVRHGNGRTRHKTISTDRQGKRRRKRNRK